MSSLIDTAVGEGREQFETVCQDDNLKSTALPQHGQVNLHLCMFVLPYHGKTSPVPLHLRPRGLLGFNQKLRVTLWRGWSTVEHSAGKWKDKWRDKDKKINSASQLISDNRPDNFTHEADTQKKKKKGQQTYLQGAWSVWLLWNDVSAPSCEFWDGGEKVCFKP